MALPRSLAAAGSWIARLGERLSLRARLLLGLLAVAAVGLAVVDVVVYGLTSSYLHSQATSELVANADASVRALERIQNGVGDDPAGRLPLDTAVEVLTRSGTFEEAYPTSFRLDASGPALAGASTQSTFTVQGKADGVTGSYLVLPRPVQLCPAGQPCFLTSEVPGVALVAFPLSSLEGTLARLLANELLVSLAVVLVLAMLGYLVVRVGLRPLDDIEETAGKIAAGDLSRRVEREDETTEVGRLGAALNVMLGTIEQSFSVQQASEERLRRFLADASHELRTPVTSIRGYAELFRRGAASRPEDLALAMRRIEEEAARMGLLVEDLLLLARLDQGRPLERERVDLAGLAIDACADAQVLAPDRTITVRAPSPVVLLGDEQRLRQVVANLVQNALRHTPAGTPVTVTVSSVGAMGRLSVRDEGPGLAPEDAARVFERFYRADPSRTRGSGGSGLGLSIVASIAAAHGGSARLETAPGRGADFVVELPLARSQPPGGAPPSAGTAEVGEGGRPPGQPDGGTPPAATAPDGSGAADGRVLRARR